MRKLPCLFFCCGLLLGLPTVWAQTNLPTQTQAQKLVMTNEDSLHSGTNKSKTVISGYGSAFYQKDMSWGNSVASLERIVLFVGHQFNNKIALFTEMELENAVVSGAGGEREIAMEQAFIKYNFNPKQYLVAGLFIPRIGILNENHLPVNFNGVERPMVEQFIIPATWREMGVGFYGTNNNRNFNYTLALLTGLNSSQMVHGMGLKEARQNGSMAQANNLALTGSLQYFWNSFKFQASTYYGGTVGLNHRAADSLGLQSGALGSALSLSECNVQFQQSGISVKALATYVSYPAAKEVNMAYANNTASAMYGAYLEAGYDWLHTKHKSSSFITFLRYEALDMNFQIPEYPYAVYDGTLKQTHLIAGINYMPIPNVTVKADVRLMHTGEQNKELLINPPPNALPYKTQQNFLNIGIGYSF